MRELNLGPRLGVRRQGCADLIVTEKEERKDCMGHGVKMLQ